MTPTLSTHFSSPIHLHILHSSHPPSPTPSLSTPTSPLTLPLTPSPSPYPCPSPPTSPPSLLYSRHSLLLTSTNRRVELGCLRVHLDALPAGVRGRVVGGGAPFGSVLLEEGVRQRVEVRGYFEVGEDEVLRGALGGGGRGGGEGGEVLYGRCCVIVGGDGRVIAEVVEILPHLPLSPEPIA